MPVPRGGKQLPEGRANLWWLFGGAMVAAPGLALLLSVEVALLVAGLALGAVAWLCVGMPPQDRLRRRWIVALALINGGLAVTCLAVLAVRLLGTRL